MKGIQGGQRNISKEFFIIFFQEKLRMLALRRHLDLLSEQVLQNDYLVNQSRYRNVIHFFKNNSILLALHMFSKEF